MKQRFFSVCMFCAARKNVACWWMSWWTYPQPIAAPTVNHGSAEESSCGLYLSALSARVDLRASRFRSGCMYIVTVHICLHSVMIFGVIFAVSCCGHMTKQPFGRIIARFRPVVCRDQVSNATMYLVQRSAVVPPFCKTCTR